jgi:hypothetical protein
VGRGVLIDFVSYVARNNLEYDPLDFYAISLKTAKQIAKECNFDFQAGDIVLLRTGMLRFHATNPNLTMTRLYHCL